MKKKVNPNKGTNKRGGEPKASDNVKVTTGLPPKVDGQLRCFCKVTVSQVLWSRSSPPSTIVRLQWWGEEGDGTIFRPQDIKKSSKGTVSTTGRYPVCSGPRQFASYLSDMGTLTLSVFTSETATEPAGQAHIADISSLSNNRPINGFFPIMSAKNQKIGELQVSVMLEPMMASYDHMGSVPTPDLTSDPRHSQESMLPSASRPQPHSQQPIKPQEDPFISPASHHTDDIRLQNGARAQNASDLRQRLRYDLGDAGQGHPASMTTNGAAVGTSDPHNSRVVRREELAARSSPVRPATVGANGGGGHESDLLSMLLSRGTELRQAMVVSSLNADEHNNNNAATLDLVPSSPPPPRTAGAIGAVGTAYSPATGVMVDNLTDLPQSPVTMLLGSPLAKHDWQMLRMLNGGSPGPSMCSEGEGMEVVSEAGDPLHDHSLLQQLFYRRSDSEMSELSGVSGDERDPHHDHSVKNHGNMRPPSRSSSFSSLVAPPSPEATPNSKRKRKSKSNTSSGAGNKTTRRSRSRSKERNPRMTNTPTAKKSKSMSRSRSRSKSRSLSRKRKSSLSDSDVPSTPRSETSRVSFDPAPSDVEEDLDQDRREMQVDGLSVERLTLLGRVHVARVSVVNLSLHGNDLDTSSSSKASGRSVRRAGKPPRPVKTRKPCTYLIEYQFPVVATSRDKYSPNAMATEVMRVASKNVTNGVISFSHRSVFPLMFDGAALEKWWKSALVFKVFSREAGQKSPVLLGSCGVSLKSILKSDDLHLTRDLEIRDLGRNSSSASARNTSLNSSRSAAGAALLGTLKVSVELASDHKDFATCLARTRVAEMSANGQNIVPVVPPPPPPVPSLPLPLPLSASPSRGVVSGYPSAKPVLSTVTQPHSGYSTTAVSHPSSPHKSSTQPTTTSLVQELSSHHKPVFQTSVTPAQPSQSSQPEALALQTLIVIPEGCNMSLHGVPPLYMASRNPALLQQQQHSHHGSSGRDQTTRNTYLVCRMFWSNDSVHSNVCWGTLNPQYDFTQVAPVLVTPSLLERMRNNYMVIEVWDKKTSAENDKLIGICKLSLHQFFMSFRDSKIAGALLKSEYPVVAIDNYMPVVDPFTGLHFGQLSVLLAMGSSQQVSCLQRLKSDKDSPSSNKAQRPNHYLERQDVYGPDHGPVTLDSSGASVEHVFEVVVQGVRGLRLDGMVWGEADCFLQYFFPTQGQPAQHGPTTLFAMPSLRSFRTATTLCIPDPSFQDVTRHRITLPVGTPVQRELLTACANSSAGSGGLPFEVWCRFYHPNVRDQVIARTTLPLAKLCAMVTMQKKGESSVQSFSLPLTPVPPPSQDDHSQAKMKDSGLLDVTVHYKTQTVQGGGSVRTGVSQVSGGSQVCLCVSVIRASGLKAAAEWASRVDSGMQYPAQVGVNTYVRFRLSFLPSQEDRESRTVARTFSPEFSHHVELPLQLLWSGQGQGQGQDDPACLAQVLETGHLALELWHQVPGADPGVREYECDDTSGGKRLVPMSGDVLLGTCTIPLSHLLVRQAGIKGWFPVDRPTSSWDHTDQHTYNHPDPDSDSDQSVGRQVGGVEVGVHFAHSSDRLKVMEAARSVGWSPVDPVVEMDSWDDEDMKQSQKSHQISVKVDQVCVPVSRVLLPGQSSLDPTARCYVRYKFYDRAAVVSRTSRVQGEGERVRATVQHRHTMVLPHTAPFLWYLREEQLEVQVWVTYGSQDKGQRPQQRDKLVGTAYVDLLPLCDSRRQQHRISGALPLYKPGTSSLAGAVIQLHLTSNLCHGNQLLEDEDEVMENGEMSDMDYDSSDSFHQLAGGARSPVKSKSVTRHVDPGSVFVVHLAVERALHLPTVRVPGRSGEAAPTTYISYQSAEKASPTYSEIVPGTTDPIWDYAAEVALSNELLTHDTKNLVLKVWHKPEGGSKLPDKSCDRVLGFVSVDLCPLNSGLRQICGWYNIVDLNGQSRGQIKVSITPVDLTTSTTAASSAGPFLASRGGSVCVASDPVAGYNFLPSSVTPAFLSLPASTTTNHTSNTNNNSSSSVGPLSSLPAPASHWQPRFSQTALTTPDSSKSMLFSSLRQQLRDLDGLTQRLRLRLSGEESDVDNNAPTSARSADILTGTHSNLSTINTTSSLTATRDALSDVSRHLLGSREVTGDCSQQMSEDSTCNNVVDSGAFSGNNTGKSQEAPDSQRSDRQVVHEEAMEKRAQLLSGLPQSEAATCTVEAQFLEESPPGALTPASPRDFSSNSQTSQGFQPMTALTSDPNVPGNGRVTSQTGPSVINMTGGEVEEIKHSLAQLPACAEDLFQHNHHHQHPPANHKDDDHWDEEDEEEEDEMFGSYHHYRALLDREENEGEGEGSNVETITPRRINDVSGMLRQFAQHPDTLPSIFSPLHHLPPSSDGAGRTWPGVGQAPLQADMHRADSWENRREDEDSWEGNREGDRFEKDRNNRWNKGEAEDSWEVDREDEDWLGTGRENHRGEGEREEERSRGKDGRQKEETETEHVPQEGRQRDLSTEALDRNSFIDSWLEESGNSAHNTLPLSHTLPHPHPHPHPHTQTAFPTSFPQQERETTTSVHSLDLDLPGSEGPDEDTPRVNGVADSESAPSEEMVAVSRHLLSNVELIDTMTTVNSAARHTRGAGTAGNKSHTDVPSAKYTHGTSLPDTVNVNTHANINEEEEEKPAEGLSHPSHLLSNVELYSTASSLHPTSRPPRHLLSNVELTSSGSSHNPDTASSRPSRQSSANSACRQRELEVCAELSEDESEVDDTQPQSSRSHDLAAFFAPPHPPHPPHVNGGYDSSEEELEYQYSAARPALVKSRPLNKGRETCGSVTATTEDSGLESGAKSSQDEREAVSLLDSTQGQGVCERGAVPEFFLRTEQLEASMRALQVATSAAVAHDNHSTQASSHHNRSQGSSDLVQRLKKAGAATSRFHSAISTKGRQLPTAEEAKRIAKIFSAKPS